MTKAMIQNPSRQYQYGCLSILFASVLWGTTGTAASFAPEINSLAVGAFSMGVGGLLQACLSFKNLRSDWGNILRHKKILTVSALALAVYPLAFYSSMKLAGVAIGTVITIATAPFFTMLLECLFSKGGRLTSAWLLSFVLGLFGIVLLVSAESTSVLQPEEGSRQLGIALGFVAGLTYAIYAWAAKAMIDAGVQSQSALGGIFGMGAMLLLPTLLFTGEALFSSVMNLYVLGYMALIPMCLAYLAFGFGLRYVKASRASLLTLLEPVVAAGLAVLIVGESISVFGWIGMALIVICLFMQSKS